ncbi:MAG: hypothetical protein DMG64_19210, partial [Acidobacteria bacterium]
MLLRNIYNPLLSRAVPQLRSAIFFSCLALLTSFCTPPAHAQRGESNLVKDAPSGTSVDEIIRRFAAKEKEF